MKVITEKQIDDWYFASDIINHDWPSLSFNKKLDYYSKIIAIYGGKMIPSIQEIIEGLLAGTYTKEQAIGWLKLHASKEAEWWYNEDGESAGDWSDCADYADLAPRGCMKVHGGMEVCTKWIGNVVLTLDDDGDPDETEYRLFDTKEAAEEACDQGVVK